MFSIRSKMEFGVSSRRKKRNNVQVLSVKTTCSRRFFFSLNVKAGGLVSAIYFHTVRVFFMYEERDSIPSSHRRKQRRRRVSSIRSGKPENQVPKHEALLHPLCHQKYNLICAGDRCNCFQGGEETEKQPTVSSATLQVRTGS